ncbi:MAG: ABC transporter permease [Bacteroidales bacterium]
MRIVPFIAGRYLFAKKSHNVINIISIISAVGIAIGSAALIIILSIYNGFEGLIESAYSTHESDLKVMPATGKYFDSEAPQILALTENPSILHLYRVIEENIFIRYGNESRVATMKGVDSTFEAHSSLKEHITEGEFSLHFGELPQVLLGRSLAYNLGLRVHLLEPLYLYYPSRNRSISLVNPLNSLNVEKLFPGGLLSVDNEFDDKYLFLPIETAQNLMEYESELSHIEITLKEGSDIKRVEREIKALLGEEYIVQNRFEQNPTLYKMLRAERLSIYIILLFVIVIVSFNLFGSLSMLIIEKSEDSYLLKALGSRESLIKGIFFTQGWMLSLIGATTGILLGLILSLIQQQWGIIKMPGNFVVESYPVVVKVSDLLLSFIAIATIGLLSALLPFTLSWKESK